MDSTQRSESDLRDLMLKKKEQRSQTEEFVALQIAVAMTMARTEDERIATAREVIRYLTDPQLELVKRDMNKRMSVKKKSDQERAGVRPKKKR